jgi:hypothetical protein
MQRYFVPLLLALSVWTFSPLELYAQANSNWTRSVGEDWPRMLGRNYDSTSSETGILKTWPKEGLRVVWTVDTGVGYGNGVTSNGRWFHFDRHGSKERLTCLNAETGAELWRWESPVQYSDPYGYNNGPRCSPVVDDDRVYVFGVAGALACVSVDDGKERWTIATNDVYKVVPNFFGVGASPLIYQDKLLVMIGGCKKGGTINDLPNAKPSGSAIVAFDKKTGKELYRVGDYLASYSAPVIAKIDGQDRCLALVREGLLSVDPNSGKQIAFHPFRAKILESVNAASPVIAANQILISECYEIGCALLKADPKGMKVLYSDSASKKGQLLRAHWSTPLVWKNKILGSSGRNEPDTDLRCLLTDTNPPQVAWTIRNRDRTTGLIVEDHAVLLGESGLLSLLDMNGNSGDAIAKMDLAIIKDVRDRMPLVETPSWAPPVLSHGLLFVRGAQKVVCLELIPVTEKQ